MSREGGRERGRETGRDHVRLDYIRRKPTHAKHHWPLCGGGSVSWTNQCLYCMCVCVLQGLYIHSRSLLGGKLCHISIFLPVQVKVQIKICNTVTSSQTRGRRTACETTQQTVMWRTAELQPSTNVSWVEDQMQCGATNPCLITDCPVLFSLLNFHHLRSHVSKTCEINWKCIYLHILLNWIFIEKPKIRSYCKKALLKGW